jgi:transposase
MPRFKTPDYGLKMIPVDFAQQVLPGTFEFALCHLVDNELDLSTLRSRYTNDAGGAPAFDPAVLLKIVLLAYSRGLISSRSIAGACRNNVLFMAVSGDSAPHFTTIAGFVAELGDEAAALFTQVLLVCDRQGLIGRELFAIDGVKLPSNAAKAKSGTRADFEREAAKMEAAVQRMMGEQKARDLAGCDDEARAARTRERLADEAAKIRNWLAANPDERRGAKGAVRLSNRTDNESAKMATGKGVIQGYTGVAAVDAAHQIVVEAHAHGTGSEQELLLPVVDAALDRLEAALRALPQPAATR